MSRQWRVGRGTDEWPRTGIPRKSRIGKRPSMQKMSLPFPLMAQKPTLMQGTTFHKYRNASLRCFASFGLPLLTCSYVEWFVQTQLSHETSSPAWTQWVNFFLRKGEFYNFTSLCTAARGSKPCQHHVASMVGRGMNQWQHIGISRIPKSA